MDARPTLETERLLLRSFCVEDADAVAGYAGAEEVSATTLNIPHPYTPAMARDWIGRHGKEFAAGRSLCLALTLKSRGPRAVIGAISLGRAADARGAELGYWLGLPFWSCGYMTEAAKALIDWGFTQWGLTLIHSHHLARNPASGRVMEKAGLWRVESRSVIWKDGRREEAVFYQLEKPQ
jgi:RimJ/RimL family protein N-acetyltransferase